MFTSVSGSGKSSLVFGTIAAESQRMGADPRCTVGTATDANAMLRILFSRLGRPRIGSPRAFSFTVASISGAGAVTLERAGRTVQERRSFSITGGMCPRCESRATVTDTDLTQLFGDSKSLAEGAITIPGYQVDSWWTVEIFTAAGFLDPDKPIRTYTKKELHDFLHREPTKVKVNGVNLTYEGLIPKVQGQHGARRGAQASDHRDRRPRRRPQPRRRHGRRHRLLRGHRRGATSRRHPHRPPSRRPGHAQGDGAHTHRPARHPRRDDAQPPRRQRRHPAQGSSSSSPASPAPARAHSCTARCAGVSYTDLAMMAGVATTCEECESKQFQASVLEYRLGNPENHKDISKVLAMPVTEAQEFFGTGQARTPAAHTILHRLADIGLGYLRLGQPLTTLSGGERQRLKLATHLGGGSVCSTCSTGSTGSGTSIIVIAHHQAVMAHADWIIDLGPSAGHDGGRIVLQSTPADLVTTRSTRTGEHLAAYVNT